MYIRTSLLSLLLAVPALAQAEAPAAPEATPVAMLRLSGPYADLPEQGADVAQLLLGGGGRPKDFYQMLGRLERLAEPEAAAGATDGDGSNGKAAPAQPAPRILFLDLTRPFALNQAQLTELARAMDRVRRAGYRTVAYVQGAGSMQYAVAAMADRVLMPEMGVLDLHAPALTVPHMKDALDLLGVRFDIVRCGDFKGAVEPYMLPRMSEHLRRHYVAMLDSMNAEMVRHIAGRRGLAATRVRELQGQRLVSAPEALAAGLVDRLVGWLEAEEALRGELGVDRVALTDIGEEAKKRRSFNPMAILAELLKPKEETEIDGSTIAVLHLAGGIVDGFKAQPGSIVSGPSVALIDKLAADDEIKGVVVRINSPGGSATASEAVRLALDGLASKKPVVFSMGRVAASGGYWITCIGRPIVAEAGTITGSIGVFGMRPSLGALMRRVGVHEELVGLDESAGMDSMSRGWTDDEKERVQAFVDRIYDGFIANVARSRSLPADEVLAIAGGRVWAGEQALERRLVDKIGGLHTALSMVRAEAGIRDDYDDVEIVHVPRPRSFMDAFAEELLSVKELAAGDATVRLALQRLGGLEGAWTMLRDALAHDGVVRVWALAPDITVR